MNRWWSSVVVVLALGCTREPARPPAPRAPAPSPEPAAPREHAPGEVAAVPGAPPRAEVPEVPNHVSAPIRISQLLVQYRGAEGAPDTVTRSRDEALALAGQLVVRARAGDDFTALVRHSSDEPGASRTGGDLRGIRQGVLTPALDAAAFALKVGDVSDPAATPFGFYVVKRTE